jgi:hypothetical protein
LIACQHELGRLTSHFTPSNVAPLGRAKFQGHVSRAPRSVYWYIAEFLNHRVGLLKDERRNQSGWHPPSVADRVAGYLFRVPDLIVGRPYTLGLVFGPAGFYVVKAGQAQEIEKFIPGLRRTENQILVPHPVAGFREFFFKCMNEGRPFQPEPRKCAYRVGRTG